MGWSFKGQIQCTRSEASTVEGAPDPKADSIEGSFVARGDEDGDIFYIGREDASGFSLEAFKKWYFQLRNKQLVAFCDLLFLCKEQLCTKLK